MADPASLTISSLALGVSSLSFAWQHLRKVDSIICTLVANDVNDKKGVFQFSFANLGTGPTLLRDIRVDIFSRPELHGIVMGNSATPDGHLPQVIKAGELFSTIVETKWTATELVEATKEAERRGEDVGVTELFFVAKATVWNPKGERFLGEKHIVTVSIDHKDSSSRTETFHERSFRLTKDSTRLLRTSISPIHKKAAQVFEQ